MMTIAEQLTILNNNLDAVGTETNTQSDIIDEIMEVLEGKAAGGGAAFETSEVIMTTEASIMAPGTGAGSLWYTDASGHLVSTSYDLTTTRTASFLAARSTIVVYSGGDLASATTVTGGTKLYGYQGYVAFYIEDAIVTVDYT